MWAQVVVQHGVGSSSTAWSFVCRHRDVSGWSVRSWCAPLLLEQLNGGLGLSLDSKAFIYCWCLGLLWWERRTQELLTAVSQQSRCEDGRDRAWDALELLCILCSPLGHTRSERTPRPPALTTSILPAFLLHRHRRERHPRSACIGEASTGGCRERSSEVWPGGLGSRHPASPRGLHCELRAVCCMIKALSAARGCEG